MVEEPEARWVSGLAEDQVEGGVVEVGEVGSEAFGWAEGAVYLFDGGAVSALRLDAGANGELNDALEYGREDVDRVLDVDGVGFAVLPAGEVGGGVGFVEAAVDGGGEEFVPVGVRGGQPACGGMHDELLGDVGFFAPGVELPDWGGWGAGVRVVVGGGAEFWCEDEGPEGVAGGIDDGGGRGVGAYVAVPVAEEVGGLVEASVFCCGVVDGVGEALRNDVIEVGVDVVLESEHVGGGKVVARAKNLPDALVAVRGGPIEGDGKGVVLGRDAGVCGGQDAVGWIEGLGKLVEGDIGGPVLSGVEAVDGDGADGAGLDETAAEGNLAYGVVADVALIVGVDDILGGASEGGEGGGEAGPVGGGVYVEERGGDVHWVVDGPAEGEGAGFGRKDAGDDGGGEIAVLGEGDVEDDVLGAADVDDLFLMEDGVPGAVGGLVFGGVAGAAGVFDEDVLDVSAEVREAPGYVVVVADDDEGKSGEGDSGDVEFAGGGRGFEVGLIPDAGDAVAEVHVVRE